MSLLSWRCGLRGLVLLSCWLLFGLTGAGGGAARAQGVANPGFETGTLSNWQSSLYGGTGSATVGNTAHSGSYGLTQGPTSQGEVVYQDIAGLTPGQTYLVSVWVASGTLVSTTVQLAVNDGQGNNWVTATLIPGTGWEQLNLSYTVTGTGAMRIHLYEAAGSETTSWDDVRLEPVLPLNGGFEMGALSNWYTYLYGGTGSASVGAAAHSGNYGLIQSSTTQGEVVYQDVFGLVPGQTYLVSAWVASSSTNTGTIGLGIQDTQNQNWQMKTITPATQWQQVSQMYTVTGTGALRLHLFENPGTETTYWDDVALTPVPPVNAGFETGTLSNWNTYFYGGTGSASVGSTAHSGSYGLVQGPNNNGEVVYQDIQGLVPGTMYLITAWAKSSAPTSSTITLAAHDTLGNGWVENTFTPTTSWQPYSLFYSVSGNGSLRLHLYENPGSETTYWDDVTVVPIPPVNAGFESGLLTPWQTTNGTIGAVSHSGYYGLTQSATSATQVTYQDVYGLTPGQTYLVSAWVLSSAATSSTVTLAVHDTLGNGWVSNTITPTTGWQFVSQAYTVNGTGALRIHLYTNPGTEVTYWDDIALSSTNGQSPAALFAGDTGLWGGFNNADLWGNSPFLSISPASPSKEYIRLNGQPIAIENAPQH